MKLYTVYLLVKSAVLWLPEEIYLSFIFWNCELVWKSCVLHWSYGTVSASVSRLLPICWPNEWSATIWWILIDSRNCDTLHYIGLPYRRPFWSHLKGVQESVLRVWIQSMIRIFSVSVIHVIWKLSMMYIFFMLLKIIFLVVNLYWLSFIIFLVVFQDIA